MSITKEDFLFSLSPYQDRMQEENVSYKYVRGHTKYKSNGEAFFEPTRAHVFEVILYPDCIQHFEAIKRLLDEMDSIFSSKFAMILHDSDKYDNDDKFTDCESELLFKDDPEFIVNNNVQSDLDHNLKKAHVHVVIHTADAKTNTSIAKMLKVSSSHVFPHTNLNSRLLYLIHRDNMDKYTYNPSSVIGTLAIDGVYEDIIAEECVSLTAAFRHARKWIRNHHASCYIQYDTYLDWLDDMHYTFLIGSKFDKALYKCFNDHNEKASNLNSYK